MMKKLGLIERNEHRAPMIAASEALERRLDDVLKKTGLA
jgi:4-hydroxy-tetrahydrodipicolinate synthase